ncbi:hypothetical protein B0H11DRAFT_1258798 [Mycena galericulata]|nr:hypothetical protein B0H11DRAFT_1258798 [Mycena galericulata]
MPLPRVEFRYPSLTFCADRCPWSLAASPTAIPPNLAFPNNRCDNNFICDHIFAKLTFTWPSMHRLFSCGEISTTHPPQRSRRTITNLIVGLNWGPQAVQVQCSHPISSNERPQAHESCIITKLLIECFWISSERPSTIFLREIFEPHAEGYEPMNLAACHQTRT